MSSPQRTSPAAFIRRATNVASFYGFRSARELESAARDRLQKKIGAHSFDAVASVCGAVLTLRPGEPALAYWATPNPLYLPPPHSSRETAEFGLQVLGAPDALGEVLLIKALSAILSEWGAPMLKVRINALGDRDSQQRFARELSLHVRKHAGEFDEKCQAKAAERPLFCASCPHERCRLALSGAPRSMTFLSEKSRAHFRLVLEHLENLGIAYEIDDLLLGDEREPHFSFAIDLERPDATVLCVTGGRFDEHLRRHSARKDGAGVGASILFRKAGTERATFSSLPPARAPKIYFVQLGLRAKLRGLEVIDILRRAHIPLQQSFDASHLSPQLTAAKTLGVSYMLIMGQREALDRTVILRSTENSSQTVVSVAELPRVLRNLK